MKKSKSQETVIDKWSPIIAAVISFIVMFPILHFIWYLPPLILLHPIIAFFSCPCSHGRDRFFLFSWGSLGSALGWFGGFYLLSPLTVFYMADRTGGYLFTTTLGIAIFGYMLHRFFSRKS
jgi:hypothetical protein